MYDLGIKSRFVRTKKRKEMTTAEKLGKVIVGLRKARNISQETMANEAQIGRKYMSDIENGKRNLSLDLLERIARYFGLPLSDLFKKIEQEDY